MAINLAPYVIATTVTLAVAVLILILVLLNYRKYRQRLERQTKILSESRQKELGGRKTRQRSVGKQRRLYKHAGARRTYPQTMYLPDPEATRPNFFDMDAVDIYPDQRRLQQDFRPTFGPQYPRFAERERRTRFDVDGPGRLGLGLPDGGMRGRFIRRKKRVRKSKKQRTGRRDSSSSSSSTSSSSDSEPERGRTGMRPGIALAYVPRLLPTVQPPAPTALAVIQTTTTPAAAPSTDLPALPASEQAEPDPEPGATSWEASGPALVHLPAISRPANKGMFSRGFSGSQPQYEMQEISADHMTDGGRRPVTTHASTSFTSGFGGRIESSSAQVVRAERHRDAGDSDDEEEASADFD